MDGDGVTDELYRVAPEDFVAERDARVAAAKEHGDRDAARAIAALRRPTRAAWLVNLLVQDRPDEVEGLLGLAGALASAQRTLDGAALREITAQRNKLVGTLTRRAAALGRDGGHRVDSGLERDVRGILESALADPDLAARVRTGRLVRAERHAGFGPEPDPGREPRPAPARAPTDSVASSDPVAPSDPVARAGSAASSAGAGAAGPDGAPDPEAARRERATARARSELDSAERAAARARDEHGTARDAAADAEQRRARAHDRVSGLTDELTRARDELTEANRAAHAASRAEREAARAAQSADTARDRAAAVLDDLHGS